MIPTFLISLREFLEVFLIVGVFLGISRKMKLHKEKEIILASVIGISLSLLLSIVVFVLGSRAQTIFTETNAELLEGYLMIFSGFFIAYVVFSLHNFFAHKRSTALIKAHKKLQQNIFDLSLFFMIIFFVLREGFEIALFTATVSLFSQFVENVAGLFLGLGVSSILGVLTFLAYVRFPITKVFKVTEYMIVLLGAAFVKNGLTELLEIHFNIHLSDLFPIHLTFLPAKSTWIGGFIKTMIGLEQGFSLGKFTVMAIYIGAVYLLFLKTRKKPVFKDNSL